ncbi:MAG: hypothetical protein V1495_00180 [Pseudomonadota bacterium]
MKTPIITTGAVGVIRSLGEVGIRSIVATEYDLSPLYWSRYCAKKVVLPSMGDRPEEAVEVLKKVGEEFPDRPPVMLGGEADVNLFSRYRDELGNFFQIKMAPPSLVSACNDKLAFSDLARRFDLAVPLSWTIQNPAELAKILDEIPFPCILKPSKQADWARDDVYAMIGRWKKAILMNSREELVSTYERLVNVTPNLVVQEYIPGSDETLYQCQAYCAEAGKVAGYFIGRKLRTQPIHFGRSTYTRSWWDPEVARVGIETLEKIGYLGATDVDLKKHEKTGRVYVLEINPRFSLLNYLATYSGVNLPLANYNDCFGLPLPPMRQDGAERRLYYFYPDWRALKEYRKTGEWNFWSWFRSLLFPRIAFFRWSWRDPMPLVGAAWGFFWLRVQYRWKRFTDRT